MSAVEDMVLIHNLTARYALAMDESRWEDWRTLWCEDEPCFQNPAGTFVGKEGFDRAIPILRERTGGKRHVMTNMVVDVTGQNASQTCYMLIIAKSSNPTIVGTAVYRDELVKVGYDWRFKKRVIEFDV
jgi:3-phenylpropionate/cinnamic acid dioxygenase small subunit